MWRRGSRASRLQSQAARFVCHLLPELGRTIAFTTHPMSLKPKPRGGLDRKGSRRRKQTKPATSDLGINQSHIIFSLTCSQQLRTAGANSSLDPPLLPQPSSPKGTSSHYKSASDALDIHTHTHCRPFANFPDKGQNSRFTMFVWMLTTCRRNHV